MSRYRKSIHQTLKEVGEWQPPTEPEILVEEAPIPTETGRELLKKRIAHKKIEKKELKYYPMGDVFRGKLQKTTQYLKEALELDDELVEAVKWEVKVSGLPTFYADGKSKGEVRKTLRKMLKRPDDIQEKSEEYVNFDHYAAEQLPYLKGRFRYELEKYYRDRYGPYLPKE